MELNREQIIRTLEHCIGDATCERCPLSPSTCHIQEDALSLIKELTEENKQFRYERKKLIEERDTFKEYAYNMQKYVENIRHKEEEGYEPSAARAAAEMEMWQVVALEKKKLTEENERLTVNMNAYGLTAKRLGEENERLRKNLQTFKGKQKSLHKQIEVLSKENHLLLSKDFDITVGDCHIVFSNGKKGNIYTFTEKDQIAKEMLEGDKSG